MAGIRELSDGRAVVPQGQAMQIPPPPSNALVDPKRPNFTLPPTPPPAAPSAAQQVSNMARTIRSALPDATSAAKAALPAVLGGAAAAADRGMRQRDLNNRPAFVPPLNQNAPGQIPADRTQTGPAPVAGRALAQTEVGRNVGNIAMALGGVPRAAATTVRGIGAAADGLRAALPVARSGVAAMQGFAAGDAFANEAPMVRPGPGRVTGATATTLPQASYSNEGRGGPRPGPAAPDLTGKIVRDGNSYSGTPGIRFGADIVSPSGKVLNTSEGKGMGFGVSSLDTSEGHRQNLMEIARAEAGRANQLRAQDAQIASAYANAGDGGGFGLLSNESRKEWNDSFDRKNMPYTERIAADRNANEMAMTLKKEAGDTSRAGMREAGDTQRNALNNETLRENNAASNEVSLRGQDTQARTSNIRAVQDAEKAKRDQANEDRRYQFEVAKFGEEAAGKRADRRASATKNLYEEIGNMLPPGPDNKPDMARAARYAEGLNAQLAEQMQAAQAELQRNPGNAAAKSFLANVEENGVNAMSPVAKRKFIAGQLAAEKAKESAGWAPWKGVDPKSAAGVSGLRSRPGLIWDDYETLDSRGEVTGVIPASRVDEDRNLDILKR